MKHKRFITFYKFSVTAKQEIGYIADSPDMFLRLKGIEFLNLTANIYRVYTEDRKERIKKFSERFELEDVLDKQMQSYSHGMRQKIMVGIMFSLMGIMIYFVPVCVIMEIPVLHTLGYCLLSVFSITFISMTGMYIDSIQPKLIWDDELSALRENYNTFFAIAIAIGIAVVLCGGGYLLYEYCGANAGITGVVIGILLLIGNAIMWLITDKYFARNIVEQEEA